MLMVEMADGVKKSGYISLETTFGWLEAITLMNAIVYRTIRPFYFRLSRSINCFVGSDPIGRLYGSNVSHRFNWTTKDGVDVSTEEGNPLESRYTYR